MGAALAYYTLFSMAPLLLIAISVAGAVFGTDTARGEILAQLSGLLGADGAAAVANLLDSVRRNDQSISGTLLGLGLLLLGATTVVVELQDALDRIWQVPRKPDTPAPVHNAWLLLVRARLMSFGLILGLGFVLLVSLALSAALAAWGRWWAPAFGRWELLLTVANHAIGFALSAAVFASIY